MESRVEECFNAGLRCLKTKKFKEAVKLFSRAIEYGKKLANAHTLYEFRSFAYMSLSLFDEAVKDGQSALFINPKSSNAYIVLGNALWLQGKKENAMTVLRSGCINANKNEKKYMRPDPILDLPPEIVYMILVFFNLSEIYNFRRISKKWKGFIDASSNLWRELNFDTGEYPELVAKSISVRNGRQYPSHLLLCESESQEETGQLLTSNGFLFAKSNFGNNDKKEVFDCSELFQKFSKKFSEKNAKKMNILTEKSVLVGIKNAGPMLNKLFVTDGRQLSTTTISELTKSSKPRLNSLTLSRIRKMSESSHIMPIVKQSLQTNHLHSLCLSYNTSVNSNIVVNIGKYCTKLRVFDVSCCPKVNWVTCLEKATLENLTSWFTELEELYINDQYESMNLLSERLHPTIRFPELNVLSMSWNKRRCKLYFPSGLNPMEKRFETRMTRYEVSWARFPKLKHICLDGHFDLYSPAIPFTNPHLQDDNNEENGRLSNLCVFSSAGATKLTDQTFCYWMHNSSKIKVLDVSGGIYLGNGAANVIATMGNNLTSLNLSGCINLSEQNIVRIVQQTLPNKIKYLDLSKTTSGNQVAYEISRNMNCYLENLVLDSTLISGNGLVEIAKSIRNLATVCSSCKKAFDLSRGLICDCDVYKSLMKLETTSEENGLSDSGVNNKRKRDSGINQYEGTENIENGGDNLSSDIRTRANVFKNINHRDGTSDELGLEYRNKLEPSGPRMKLLSINKCENIGVDAVVQAKNWLGVFNISIPYNFA
ncbi:hypothetical protein BB559_001961 [Furculomyces boomerangus]|uniref:F-box domain-containing protein n=1 Tax=Furculomyces boomerangus TaxID=61424 RepID=A0A2T9YZ02_9FUNG|nr:hypothetical protein BB559_001961 [Furculomyces boomerangus]